MVSKRDFLDAGLRVLAEDGESKIRIDHLCAIQGVTKGSFYYHFTDMADYRRSLMSHYETEFTTRYIDKVESEGDRSGSQKLAALAAAVMQDDERELKLESRIRGWATRDSDVRAALKRVDAVRCDYLFACCQTEIGDPARAWRRRGCSTSSTSADSMWCPPRTGRRCRALWTLAVAQLIAREPA